MNCLSSSTACSTGFENVWSIMRLGLTVNVHVATASYKSAQGNQALVHTATDNKIPFTTIQVAHRRNKVRLLKGTAFASEGRSTINSFVKLPGINFPIKYILCVYIRSWNSTFCHFSGSSFLINITITAQRRLFKTHPEQSERAFTAGEAFDVAVVANPFLFRRAGFVSGTGTRHKFHGCLCYTLISAGRYPIRTYSPPANTS